LAKDDARLLRVKKNARGAHNEKKGDEDSEIAWSTRRAIMMASRNALERARRCVTALLMTRGDNEPGGRSA
jgi:hypothetical protein